MFETKDFRRVILSDHWFNRLRKRKEERNRLTFHGWSSSWKKKMGSAVNLSFSFRTPLTFYHLWAHSFKLLKVIPYGGCEPVIKVLNMRFLMHKAFLLSSTAVGWRKRFHERNLSQHKRILDHRFTEFIDYGSAISFNKLLFYWQIR